MQFKQQIDVDLQPHKISMNDNDNDVRVRDTNATEVESKLQSEANNHSTIPLEKYMEKVEKLQKVNA